jgi:hypothetical protein
MARADLAALFDAVTEEELEDVLDEWFSEESQRVMRELVERLAKRKG